LITAVEDISITKKRLKIEIPTDIIEKEYRESLDKVKKRAKIPGFRPGKVPANLIEKKFGGDIKADIIDRLVPRYYSEALKEAALVPVALPKFESSLDVKPNEPLAFVLTVEVRPNITDLNYTGLKVEEVTSDVDDKEIEDTVKGLREERAVYEAIDREIKEDDLLVIDYVRLDPTGQKELSSGKDQVMNLGSNLAPKGIMDEIIGRKKGDVIEITLPSVEGGEVKEEEKGNRLRITIKEIKEKRLPEIDDELAKDLGHETLESLRGKVKEGILRAKKDKAASTQKEKLLEMLVESYDFELPESLFEKELETLVINEKHSRQKPKDLALGSDVEKTAHEDDAATADRLRPKAIRNVKAGILLDLIAEKEGITASEEELKTRIELLARHLQTTPEAVINLFVTKDGSLDNLKHTIRDEKVMDLVLSRAEITKGASS